MDIPALGVDGACLSIIGQLGQSRGVLIFHSRKDFEQFLKAAANGNPEQPGAAFGADVLSLTFHNATQLPPAMRREAMQNGWSVNSPDAYPVVARRDPAGIPQPLVERDVDTVAATALALSAFLPKHAAIFKAGTFRSASRTSTTRTARSASPSPAGRSTSSTSMDPPIRKATPEPLHRHCAPASPPETTIFGKNEARAGFILCYDRTGGFLAGRLVRCWTWDGFASMCAKRCGSSPRGPRSPSPR